jgi:hypothetical protein
MYYVEFLNADEEWERMTWDFKTQDAAQDELEYLHEDEGVPLARLRVVKR